MTTGVSEIEVNKYVGPVSTIQRNLTRKVGDLTFYFDKVNEENIRNIRLKEIIIDNYTIQAKKRKKLV